MYGKSVHFVGVLVLFHSLLFFLHEDWRGETIDFRPKHFIAWEEGNSYYWNQRFPLMKPSASSKQWARKRRKKCWNLCIFPRFLSIKVTRDLRSVSRNKKKRDFSFFLNIDSTMPWWGPWPTNGWIEIARSSSAPFCGFRNFCDGATTDGTCATFWAAVGLWQQVRARQVVAEIIGNLRSRPSRVPGHCRWLDAVTLPTNEDPAPLHCVILR